MQKHTPNAMAASEPSHRNPVDHPINPNSPIPACIRLSSRPCSAIDRPHDYYRRALPQHMTCILQTLSSHCIRLQHSSRLHSMEGSSLCVWFELVVLLPLRTPQKPTGIRLRASTLASTALVFPPSLKTVALDTVLFAILWERSK